MGALGACIGIAVRLERTISVGTCVALLRRSVALTLPLAAVTVSAQQPEAAAAAALPAVEVVAVAHRSGRPLEEVAPSVSVVERADIEQRVAGDLRGLLRHEPGVAVENSVGRFGLGDVVIRGIGGNRVLMQIDGVRLPDSYRVGRFSSASRNQFDLPLLRRVEILRGPGSALYGSDALGGVLSLATVEPADFLSGAAPFGGEAGAGYASASDRWSGSALLAAEQGALQALIGYQHGSGHETGNRGDNDAVGRTRTAPDPQRSRSDWLLGKLVWNGAARWRLTLERHEQVVRTDVLSLNPQSVRTVQLNGDDDVERRRASADVDALRVGHLERLRAQVYVQRSLTVNDTADVRANTTAACLSAPGSVTCRRDVRFRLEQKETGASVLAEVEGLGHWLFGAEFARIHYDEQRDGTQTDLGTGQTGTVVGGEPMPTRDFPLTRSDRVGLFIQHELRLAGGRLGLVPALRFDSFRTDAQPDAVFDNANPGRTVVDSADRAWSPKLALVYRAAPGIELAAQLATGFRAPPAADLNLGLSNLPAGLTVVPNPELKAERSRSAELGVRARGAALEFSAAAFVARYEDLIVSRAPLPCPAHPACVPGATTTFQSQNIARARVHGVEAALRFRLDRAWSLRASYAQAAGSDTANDRPLNTIDPPRAVLSLLFGRPALDAGLHATHIRAKQRVDRSAGDLFAPPSATVLDLTVGWRFAARWRLAAGVFNLLDEKYWLWSDLRGVPAPGATVDRYTQPGRNASVLLRAAL